MNGREEFSGKNQFCWRENGIDFFSGNSKGRRFRRIGVEQVLGEDIHQTDMVGLPGVGMQHFVKPFA